MMIVGPDPAAPEVEEVEVTVSIGVRIRVPAGTPHHEVVKACLAHIHGQRGYVLATAQALREDPAHTMIPYPIVQGGEALPSPEPVVLDFRLKPRSA